MCPDSVGIELPRHLWRGFKLKKQILALAKNVGLEMAKAFIYFGLQGPRLKEPV